jgi:hypothetical protein
LMGHALSRHPGIENLGEVAKGDIGVDGEEETMSNLRRGHCSARPDGRVAGAQKLLSLDLEEDANLNHVIVSGPILRELDDDRTLDGVGMRVLLIAFDAPKPGVRYGVSDIATVCEVEIPYGIVDPALHDLRIGKQLIAYGQLTVMGGVRSSTILSGGSIRE